jgi:DNA-binding NarL/FixJ family response regulator
MIRIIIAEDFPIIREGMCKLLEGIEDFELIGQAENGIDTLRIVKERKPDVLVLDILMPELDGIEVLKQIHDISAQTKVVILSMYADIALVQQTLALGALGYVLKQSISDELIDAIRAANRGSGYLCAGVSHFLSSSSDKKTNNPLDRLSPRERQVVSKIISGLSTKEIAAVLQVSVKTVEKQRRDAMRKLEVENTASLVRTSLQLGFLSSTEND